MPDGRSKVPRVVGDFLLIVVGVLAALAADSWMDRSRDAFLERRYLAELSRALTSDTSEIRASIAHSTQRTADAGKVLHVLRGSGSVGDVGEFVVAVYLAGQFNIPESETAVFDELLIIPGANHGMFFPGAPFSDYLWRAVARYFMEHLGRPVG